MNDQTLALTIVLVIAATVWLMVTSKVTAAERDEMLNDDEMWP